MSGQTRYRTTCDNCLRSKVRCSKDHPSCHRCLSQGTICVYSRSRKSKKPIEHRHQIQHVDFNPNETADFSTAVSSGNDPKKHSAAVSLQDGRMSPVSVSSSANDQSYRSPWSVFGDDNDMQDSMLPAEDMEPLKGATHPARALLALNDPLPKSLTDWATHEWSGSMETPTREAPTLVYPEFCADFITPLGASSGGAGNTFGGPHEAKSTLGDDSIEAGANERSCARIAASLLRSLESPGAPLKHSSQPSYTAHRRLLKNLDAVISTNKAAIEALNRISGCTCSVPGNHLINISAVLFTVLAWYEACLGACDLPSEQGLVRTGFGEAGASETRSHELDELDDEGETVNPKDRVDPKTGDDAMFVCIPPIQVGSLQLSPESRRQVVAQLVFTELATATKEIGSLTKRLGGMSSAPVGIRGHQESEAQLQFSLQAALQTRITTISRAAERASK